MRRSIRSAVLVSTLVLLAPAAWADYPPEVDASIILTKTVGIGPGCAPTNDITVPLGSLVTYCYQVGNTGDTNLMTHTLVDSQLGTLIGPNAVFNLLPGQVFTHQVENVGPIVQTVINTATWTAITNVVEDKYDGILTATSTAMATVSVLEESNDPCSDEIDNDVDNLVDCEDPGCFDAPVCSRNPVPVAGSWGMLGLALVLLAGGMTALTMRRRAA